MQNKTKQFSLTILLLSILLFASPIKAQITIGALFPPQLFSLLELTTVNRVGGLRLPQLTTKQRDELTTDEFKANLLAEGLIIFNVTTNCLNIWNGSVWIEMDATASMRFAPKNPNDFSKAIKIQNKC